MSGPLLTFASSLTVARGPSGQIHLQLRDEDGEIFAVAAMSLLGAGDVVADIQDFRIEIAREPGLLNTLPAGRA
ncbi:MAG: hypothetical protein WDN08_05515 [Rhizomicrobium sp.]